MWWPAHFEVRSALERLRRGGDLSPTAYNASLDRLAAMIESWGEIEPADAVRERACALAEAARAAGFNVPELS